MHPSRTTRIGTAARSTGWRRVLAGIVACSGMLVAGAAAAYDVVTYSKTGDDVVIAGGSSSGDARPFVVDLLAAPELPPFGASTTHTGRVELVFRLLEPAVVSIGGDLFTSIEGQGSASRTSFSVSAARGSMQRCR